jgi:hypothetical protein
MATQYQISPDKVRENNHNRLHSSIKIFEFEEARGRQSQRQFSQKEKIPRTTLQYWLKRKEKIDASPALIDFFESPDGVAFLHRLVTVAHLEFTKVGVASIHNVSNFLKACGLAPFIGSSYATQRRISNKMDKELIRFGKSENDRLATQMPPKAITLAEDETFHPEICLVAMEPVSNYILLEKYAENRKGETWDTSVKDALTSLPVKVIQVTSDQGSGLLNHVKKRLGVHHSSDIFHVSHDIGKGTSGPLASKIRRAEKAFQSAEKQVDKIKEEMHCYDSRERRPRGRRPGFEKRVNLAEKQRESAEAELLKARENQETIRAARKRIGHIYHPYDPITGEKQDPSTVESLLDSCFSEINKAAADLSGKCRDRVEKAYKVVANLVSTIAFFWTMVDQHLENMNFSGEEKILLKDRLIPGFYLSFVAEKEKDKVRRELIQQQSAELLSIINQHDGLISGVNPEKTASLIQSAKECAQFFQRSSSCVEGRNAQLSLRHHGIHRLSDSHLQAQTVIHNFHIKREDNTTPALRFFEAEHGNLLEHLLNNMDYPPRPRNRLAMAA